MILQRELPSFLVVVVIDVEIISYFSNWANQDFGDRSFETTRISDEDDSIFIWCDDYGNRIDDGALLKLEAGGFFCFLKQVKLMILPQETKW